MVIPPAPSEQSLASTACGSSRLRLASDCEFSRGSRRLSAPCLHDIVKVVDNLPHRVRERRNHSLAGRRYSPSIRRRPG